MTAPIAVGWRQRPFLLTFLAALTVRLAYDLILYGSMGPNGLAIEDSRDYLTLGANLLAYGDFVDVTAQGTLVPHFQFLPVYPLILAVHMALFGADPLFPVLTQAFVGALTCVLIARTAAVIDPRLALPAGLFAAVNPTLFILDGLVLTETFFILFCALSMLSALRWLEAPNWRWTILLALSLGLGLFTRTMLLPWVAAVPVLLAIAALVLRRLTVLAAIQLLAVVVGAIVVVAPMMVRNQETFGTYQLTAQSGTVFLLWMVPLTMEAADGTPHAAGAEQMRKRYEERYGDQGLDPFAQSSAMTAVAMEAFAELGPLPILKAWSYGAAINLLAPAVILSPPVRLLPRTGFYAFEGDSKVEKIIAFLFHNDNPLYGWVLLLGSVGVVACRLIQLYGFFTTLRSGRFGAMAALLLLAWIGFILAVNGPVASPKYRQPAEIALTIFFAAGLRAAIDRRSERAPVPVG